MYWNINVPMSYDKLFNFIVSNRGSGKTYGTKEHCVKAFIKRGEQFIYVRRYKTELKKIGKYFDDISHKFENKLEVKGRDFYIDNKIAGYSLPLSTAKIEKSNAYPNVKYIIFDEFIIDKGCYHYLHDEVTAFLELYETVARLRDVRVLFLGNAITFTNPYFLYFDLKPPKEANGITVKDDILLQYVADVDFIEVKKMTRFGKMINGTEYGNYAIENKMLRDNDTFVGTPPSKKRYFFTIKSSSSYFGCWFSDDNSYLWLTKNYDPNFAMVVVTVLEDHTPNTMMIKGIARSDYMKTLEKAFKHGLVRFDSVQTKNIMMQTLKFLGG